MTHVEVVRDEVQISSGLVDESFDEKGGFTGEKVGQFFRIRMSDLAQEILDKFFRGIINPGFPLKSRTCYGDRTAPERRIALKLFIFFNNLNLAPQLICR